MGRRRGGQKFQERRAKARAFGNPPRTKTHNIPVYKRLLRAAAELIAVKSVSVKPTIIATEILKKPVVIINKETNVKVNRPIGIATRFINETPVIPVIPAVRDWDTASEVSTLANNEIAEYLPTPIRRTLPYQQAIIYAEPLTTEDNGDLLYLPEPYSPEVITID